MGGQGGVIGIVVGALLIGTLQNLLVMLNVNPYWHKIVISLVLLAAITIDYARRRRRVLQFSKTINRSVFHVRTCWHRLHRRGRDFDPARQGGQGTSPAQRWSACGTARVERAKRARRVVRLQAATRRRRSW